MQSVSEVNSAWSVWHLRTVCNYWFSNNRYGNSLSAHCMSMKLFCNRFKSFAELRHLSGWIDRWMDIDPWLLSDPILLWTLLVSFPSSTAAFSILSPSAHRSIWHTLTPPCHLSPSHCPHAMSEKCLREVRIMVLIYVYICACPLTVPSRLWHSWPSILLCQQ